MVIFVVWPCDIGREIYKLMRGWMSGTFCETFSFWCWCLLNGRRVGKLQLHFVSTQSKQDPSNVSKTTFSILKARKRFCALTGSTKSASDSVFDAFENIFLFQRYAVPENSLFFSPFTYMFSFPRRVTVCWAFFRVLYVLAGWKKERQWNMC